MNQKKILVVDDEEDICNMLKQYLELYNYIVVTAKNGEEALKAICNKNRVDLIILDIMMPGLDGIRFCKIIREKINCPILFLSAKNLEEDKVAALSIGGDDYITKPFSFKELKARIESHLRRENRIRSSEAYMFSSGNIIIDIYAKQVFCMGKQLQLTKKEYEIIEFVMLNKNTIFSRNQIFEKIWGFDSDSNLDVVTEIIKNIRKKIKEIDKENSYITTVYGIGYKWEVKHEGK
ncbi:response regulator transcription factor [Aceticella autotrophica]|uniref:Stage 0 sporulation protein A homolog n=1 Tax=Aceticella autotrophica TaxID=2755338 RepID=A0A975GAM8_9THEO|nr:response regulator transcription factor [Aceticella autotrophica]QSZ27445.1 response regulator transcription factor [Aceticella autotrophica]